jgi:hypothetical protein
MPSYYILSLFQKRKEKYGDQIARAREELAQFDEGLDDIVGAEVAAAVRQYIHVPWKRLFRGEQMPEVPPEGQAALAEARRLIRQETSITRHLHSGVCCYSDCMTAPHVLSCYGIDWDDLESLHEGGRRAALRWLWQSTTRSSTPKQP